RLVMEVGGIDRAAMSIGAQIRRGQLSRPVEQEGRGPERAACVRVYGSILERGRHCLLRLVARGRQLPRPSLGVLEQLGETRVDRRGWAWRCGLGCARREERVREADPLTLGLDDPSFACGQKTDVAWHARGRLRYRDRRMRVRGGGSQKVTARSRQREE